MTSWFNAGQLPVLLIFGFLLVWAKKGLKTAQKATLFLVEDDGTFIIIDVEDQRVVSPARTRRVS